MERVFGCLKNKFRCFFNGIQINLETAKAAIVAIAVIHNLIRNDNIEQGGWFLPLCYIFISF